MVKVAIGGPPHSGKTVLMGLLRTLLPRDSFVVVEAAPDGEGITGWSFEADPELVKAVRRKGKFLDGFVDWVVDSVRNSRMPVTLVDLGGMLLDVEGRFSPTGVKLTSQNERILSGCDYLLVIASPKYDEVVPTWISEAGRLGVKPLAILESVLVGAEDEVFETGAPLKARITRLERETPPIGSPTARAVAELLIKLAGQPEPWTDGSELADVNFPRLAEGLNLPVRNGGSDRDWLPAVLPGLLAMVSAKVAGQSKVCLWGNTPLGAPYHALACGLKSTKVFYYDPKVAWGYVGIPEVEPQGEGSQLLNWRVEERDDHTLVEFGIPGQIFDVKNLPLVIPPSVKTEKGIVISGKAPRWLTGAIARSYTKSGTSWVAVFEPGESSRTVSGKKWSELHPSHGPAVVVFSNDSQVPVGSVIPFPL